MQWWKNFSDDMKGRWDRYQNADFKSAAMGVCALVASADGNVSAEERAKVVKAIGSLDALKSFNAGELGDLFRGLCDKAADEFSRLDVVRLVGKLKGTESADIAIKVGIIIANADGNFDESEKKVVKELCATLGLDATTYLAA